MKSLKDISSFGANAAEDDPLLAQCFQSHPAYQKVIEDQHFLILGRKGSGKTAIYKEIIRLSDERHDIFSAVCTFKDYPWEYHNLMVMPAAAEQERYLHSWHYFILLSLAGIILNHDQSLPLPNYDDSYDKIKQFVKDSYGTTDFDHTRIFQPKRLSGLKKFGIEFVGFKAEVESDDLGVENLPRMLPEVNKCLQRLVIETLNPEHQYYVCFDGLDIGFRPDSPEYKQRLLGLILASRQVASAAGEFGRKVKVPVFLRSDIYKNHLLFEDKNKLTRTYLDFVQNQCE